MYKKILFVAAVVAGFASCSDDYDKWVLPKQNVAVAPVEVTIGVTPVQDVIDFNTLADEKVQVIKVDASENVQFKDGFTYSLSADGKDYAIYPDATGMVKAEDLKNAVIYLYGRKDEVRTVTGIIKGTATIASAVDTTSTRVYFEQKDVAIKAKLAPTPSYEHLYLPGNGNNWGNSGWNIVESLASVNGDGIYTGYAYLNTEFKITVAQNWDTSYGTGDLTLSSTLAGDGNIKAPAAGMYLLTVNLVDFTIDATQVEWSIVGSATDGGWDAAAATPMDYDAAASAYVLEDVELKAGALKFIGANNWDYNFGGTPEDLTAGGGDITIAEDGTYSITFSPIRTEANDYKVQCTIEKQ